MNLCVAALIKSYGFFGITEMLWHLLKTRLFFPRARLVRFPIHVRGRYAMEFHEGLTTGRDVRLDAFPLRDRGPVLVIGRNVQINDAVHIGAADYVEIGDDTLIASRVFITDHGHGGYGEANPDPDRMSTPDIAPAARPIIARPVRIGRRVWLGEQVCVLPGVTIGDGAIVGAGSVVTHDVQPATIVAGNPARVIRRFDAASGLWVRV